MSSSGPFTTASTQSTLQNLRPLSIGEVLDRAFSITFKNIVVFAAIVLVVVGPEIVFNYLGSKNFLDIFTSQLGSILQGPTPTVPPTMDPTKILEAEAAGGPYYALTMLIALLFVPLSNAAVVSGVSRAYLGLPVRFADCYRDAVKRWGALLLLLLLWIAAVIGAYIAFIIFFIVLAMAIVALSSMLHAVGAVLGAVVGVAVGIALLLLAMQMYIAVAYSFTASVLEGLGPTEAFTSGFRRVFSGGQFWRSAGIAASLFGIWLGFAMVAAIIGGGGLLLTHSFATYIALSAIVNAFIYPFIFAVVAVSYYDVRIRREGFDLQLLATRLGGQTAR